MAYFTPKQVHPTMQAHKCGKTNPMMQNQIYGH